MTSILFTLIFSSLGARSETVVAKCFPNLDFSRSKIECVLTQSGREMTFTLTEGTAISVTGPSKFGMLNKNLKVETLTHMAPRLTDAGPMDESLKFLAKSVHGSYQATMNFACHQTGFALVGFDALTEKEFPKEHVAVCQVQAVKTEIDSAK